MVWKVDAVTEQMRAQHVGPYFDCGQLGPTQTVRKADL